MKRKLSFLMTLVIALCTSSAWAQSVVSVGTNLDFSEGTPVDNGICTYAKDMESNGTTYSQMLEVPGWTIEGENGDARAAGLFAYGSGYWLGGADGYYVPSANSAGVAEGNALGVVAVWSATAQYTQAVTLEPGDYVISIPVYNAKGGTTAPTKSLIGFIADDGTEYLAPAKTYAVDTWTVENIKFTLTETTSGKLSLGYTAPNAGSGGNQHLFFDKVEVMAVTETDLARIDLNAALVSAQAVVDAKAGVGAGLFMYSEEVYNTYAAAVAAAKSVSENAEATKDDLVAALAALNAATEAYVVTAPAADAVYAFKFNGTENYLTIGESSITIEATDDPLSFEAVGNGKYYIHDKEGKYLSYAGTNNWTMTASADVKDEWTVSVNAEGLYTLTGKNGGLGVDGTEAGASCYGDKKGSAVALWTINEIVIEEEPVVDPNDYTSYIVNADLSTTDAWNAEGTKGISGGMVKVGSGATFDFSQTITLPAGQYKMTAQAAYRYSGGEQSEYDAIQTGTETHFAKLYAETATKKYEVNVQNRYEGASETDYAAGSGSVTVNSLYVPNSSAAVQTWFANGKYVNEVVFNVYEDGQVKIGIAKTESPEVGDYANIGVWTLTRLGDAVEEPIEPEIPVYTMVQNEADLVAGGKYLIMAEVDGGWVALSDLNGKIRVPSCTLTVSENYTVATTVATAVAETPAIFEGAAYELTLEGEPGAWKFKDELNGAYLHWSSGNYLINDAEGSAWTIAFNQYAHNAVITHAVTTERVLQYNASAPRFCAYTSVQKPVYLFKAGEVTVAPVAPSNPSFNTIAELLDFEIGNVVDLNVNNAKITYLSGNNMSITDGTDTLAIYDYNIPAEYVVEGFLGGTITATLGEYKGNKQLTVVDWSEVTFSEPPYFVDGDYLIVNTETGCYLGGGNDWGTHATLLGKPQFFTFAHQGNNAYTLDSHQSNGGDSHFLSTGLYCDGAAANWTFAKNENGNYTINNGGNYLAGNGANSVIVTVTEVTAAAEWTIISKAEAFAALDNATVENPADATIYISNPECKRNAGGWTITSADGTGTPSNYALGGGGNTANCAESYHSTNGFDMSQVLVGMKPGIYRLDAHAFYRNDGDNTGAFPYIYVNDQQSLFPECTGSENSMAAAYASFLKGDYAIEPIYFTIAEGDEVKIGAHGDNTAFWNIWGEFGLTYYGDATMEDIMLAVPRQEFVDRYAAMEMFSQEELNYVWNGINNNYFWPVMDAAMVIKDDIDNVTDMALLDSMMTEMDNAEDMVLKAYVLGDEYNKVKNLFWDASDNSTAISDEARMAMEAALENSNYASYTIATIEDLEAAIVDLKAEYIAYVGNATPVEGFLFDVTCMFVNPSFDEGNINGWTATEGWQFQNNQVYTNEGAELNSFMERWVGGTGLGNTSTMQTLTNMPNGAYRISADIMATAQYDADPKGHTTGAYWVANADSVAVATANGTPEHFTVETIVVDGNLSIGLVGVNTTANWMGLDNVAIEYFGVKPVNPCLKTYEVNLVDVKVGDWTIETVIDSLVMAEITELLGAQASELTYQLVDTTGVHSNYNGNPGELLFWVDLEGNLSNWGVNNKFFISYDSVAPAITTTQYGVAEGDVLNATVRLANAEGQYVEIKITESIFVSPIINIADYEIVSTIKVEHNETVGVTYSGNTASFDPISTAAALGVASLDEAEQYILNVTTGNLVANTTDGWRDANGDAAGWGNEGGVCVKINVPSSGSIDYIGCYDATHEVGEVYIAKWAFVHEGKAVVIEVVITFIPEDGIDNIESIEDTVIYTITGKRVQGDVKSLEQGIYIVNGKKVLVK